MSPRRHWFFVGTLLFLAATRGFPARAADTNALLEQGTKLYEKGQYDKALRIFVKVKKEDPSNAVAREYISRCTGKIVEQETGARLNRAVKRAEAPSATIESNDPMPSWAITPGRAKSPGAHPGLPSGKRGGKRSAPLPDFLTPVEKTTSKLLIQQEQLRDQYKNRILEGSPLTFKRSGKQLEVVAFLNRLFLPFSDALAPDAIPELERVARELETGHHTSVVLRAVDSLTPAVRHQMLDLPARRAAILFSYFAHASFGSVGLGDRTTFTAADLDD
ncbi:MAG: hypothetical protein IPP35_02820 [Elusimicrobia bacterium]|nr:hypothetical protein [Elusimicrobiota bacterium]